MILCWIRVEMKFVYSTRPLDTALERSREEEGIHEERLSIVSLVNFNLLSES